MKGYRQHFENVRQRPGMYLGTSAFDAVVAYVMGYDDATYGGILQVFHEGLVVRTNGGNNLHWKGIVLCIALPDDVNPERAVLASENASKVAVGTMFDLIEQFTEDRENRGLRKIILDYEEWLRRQDWYDASSPQWYERPSGS